ncbi:MAG: hypothetical protein AB8G96_04410 [Phycisphaerales bacterium]
MTPATRPAPAEIDWPRLYGHALTYVEQCWEKYECGSYCCCTNHEDFTFRFIQSGQAWLPLLPMEKTYLESIDKLQDDGPGHMRRYAIEFSPGREAAIYMMRCRNAGNCRHCEHRPLICRIYPYFPVPSPGGDIERLMPSSIFDVAMHLKEQAIGCPILAEPRPDLEQQVLERYGVLFEHPHIIFGFRAAATMMDVMVEHLRRDHGEILRAETGEFWSQWEMLFLTGALFPKDVLAARIRADYEAVAAVWGDFATDVDE